MCRYSEDDIWVLTQCWAVLDGRCGTVLKPALEQLRLALPFHLAGIHSDNDSEFINNHLLRWCTAEADHLEAAWVEWRA